MMENQSPNSIVIDSPTTLLEYESYLHDESKLSADRLKEIFFPRSSSELSRYFVSKMDAPIKFTISGARTGVVGGAVPLADNGALIAVISLEKLNQIKGIEFDDSQALLRVESGVRLSEVSEFLNEHAPEVYFPIDPTERSASFGGMASTNAGGARSFRYGNIRKWIQEITIVLVNGEILKIRRGQQTLSSLAQLNSLDLESLIEIQKPELKKAIGPDLSKGMDLIDLFIGAEGIFGVLTEVVVRLERKPKEIIGFLQFFKEESLALKLVEDLRSSFRKNLMAIEFFDNVSIQYALKSKKPFGEKIQAILNEGADGAVFFELDLESYSGDLDLFLESYMEISGALGINVEHCVMALDASELEDIKSFRHAVPEQINANILERKKTCSRIRKVSTDMAVADEHLEEIIKIYRDVFSAEGLEFAIFGHIGDNHLHVNVLPDGEAQLDAALIAYAKIAEKVVALGGVVSAEHGIGRIKKEFFQKQFNSDQITQLKGIKSRLDPDFKLNSGVLFDV